MILDQLLNATEYSASFQSLITVYSVSLIVGLSIAAIYITHANLTLYSKSFGFTLIIVVVLMAAILFSVGSNIAVSISLFGALSLLRFRAVVQANDEMGFLLGAVTCGLLVGTRNYSLLLPVLFSFLGLVILYKFIKVKVDRKIQYVAITYQLPLTACDIINEFSKYNLNDVIIEQKKIMIKSNKRKLVIRCCGSPSDTIEVVQVILNMPGAISVNNISNAYIGL